MTVRSLAVGPFVLQLLYLTEVARFYFQEAAVEARIQVVELDSEEKISLGKDFSLWDKESSPVNNNQTAHTAASLPYASYCSATASRNRSHKLELR